MPFLKASISAAEIVTRSLFLFDPPTASRSGTPPRDPADATVPVFCDCEPLLRRPVPHTPPFFAGGAPPFDWGVRRDPAVPLLLILVALRDLVQHRAHAGRRVAERVGQGNADLVGFHLVVTAERAVEVRVEPGVSKPPDRFAAETAGLV